MGRAFALVREELSLFFAAVTYFTRLPIPFANGDPSLLNGSLRYFPITGWIVGGCGAAVLIAGSAVLPSPLAVLLSMVATLVLTGAFHEDGFADSLDGMGGGHTRDEVLRIMKDSRMGAFGTIGLIMILAIKFFSLVSISAISPFAAVLILVTAHTLSRFMSGSLIYFMPYARKGEGDAGGEGKNEKPSAAKALPFTGK